MKKAMIYESFGIRYQNGKIFSEYLNAWINPILVNGNAKLGKNVWTFSTLPGTEIYRFSYNGNEYCEKGTCVCDCTGCYAKTGYYRMKSVIVSNGIKTMLSRFDRDFLKRAIIAQIQADNIEFLRIHASGDFFSIPYIEMWKEICIECSNTQFWTYTKNPAAENAFDTIANCNIVKSVIPQIGLNFGHCDYIMSTFETLKSKGENVYICKCGIDKNQHCNNCTGCSKHKYVLFIEHSTNYQAEKDIAFPGLKNLIANQKA